MKKLFAISVLTFLLTTPVTVLAGNGGGVSGTATGSVSCTGEGTGQYSFTYVGDAAAISPFHLTFLVNNSILQAEKYTFLQATQSHYNTRPTTFQLQPHGPSPLPLRE